MLSPLVFIFNRCIDSGHWPTAFKESIIVPIYKKGDKEDGSNYRPISLITTLTKVFEKVIKKRLISYVTRYNLISAKQFGFKENTSTEDAIVALTTKVHAALNQSDPCLCTFIDLSKAFDTVSHSLLLQSLDDIGVRQNSLKLFQSYLTNRRQSVRINNIISDTLPVEYGVPQGTVLGPILFSIYINDLFSLSLCTADIIGFADDTAVFFKAHSWDVLKRRAEKDLTYIKNWFDHKLLTINFEKTHYLPFSSYVSGLPPFTQLKIEIQTREYIIMPKTEIKYLGVVIDRHLRWDCHIKYTIKKLQTILYRFRYLKNIFNLQQLRVLYLGLVESHLRYGIVAWGSLLKTHLCSLEVLQRRFLRIILAKDLMYPSDQLFKEAHVFDIRQLYYYCLCTKYHQLKDNATLPDHSYETRQKHLHSTPFMSTSVGQRSYAYLAPKMYNTAPAEIKNVVSIILFKKKLKNYMFEQSRSIFNNYFQI